MIYASDKFEVVVTVIITQHESGLNMNIDTTKNVKPLTD